MPIPALDARERQLYKDYFTAYEIDRTANWDTGGYAIAKYAGDGATPLVNIHCNAHLTPNFDQPRSPAGQDKQTNIDTSDLMTCQRQIVIDPDWTIFIRTRWGDTYWLTVDGESEREVLVPCTCVSLVPGIPLPGITPPAAPV